MDFQSAIDQSQISKQLVQITELSPLGRPPLTQDAADLAIAAAQLEIPISAVEVVFTHLCESSFAVNSKPNSNGYAQETSHWDISDFQYNVFWTRAYLHQVATANKVSTSALRDGREQPTEDQIFGTVFFNPDLTPSAFSGDRLWSARMAARLLLSKGRDPRSRCVGYTGPLHQEKRGLLYDSLIEYFGKFFSLYQS